MNMQCHQGFYFHFYFAVFFLFHGVFIDDYMTKITKIVTLSNGDGDDGDND